MKMERQQEREITAGANSALLRLMPKGTRIYSNVLHYSRTGTTRSVQFLIVSNGEIVDVSGLIARAVGKKCDAHAGVPCQDSGYDVLALLGLRLHDDYKAYLDNFRARL